MRGNNVGLVGDGIAGLCLIIIIIIIITIIIIIIYYIIRLI